jgi:hypothetical protein
MPDREAQPASPRCASHVFSLLDADDAHNATVKRAAATVLAADSVVLQIAAGYRGGHVPIGPPLIIRAGHAAQESDQGIDELLRWLDAG